MGGLDQSIPEHCCTLTRELPPFQSSYISEAQSCQSIQLKYITVDVHLPFNS